MSRRRACTCRGDALGQQPGGRREPAGRLDLLHERPRGAGELVGERLDEPRAAGGVEDLVEVGLLEQDRLRVASDAPAQLGRRGAAQVVVGEHGDGVGAGDAGREARDRRAQRVHPRVVGRHHRPRRHGVDGRRRVRRADLLGDTGPQQADGAERGDRGELVGGRGEAQLDAGDGVGGRDTACVERPEVLDAGGDRGAELLGIGGAGVVEAGAVDGDDAQAGAIGAERRDPRGDGVELGVEVERGRVGRGDAEGIGAERAGLQVGADRGGGVLPAGAGVEHDPGEVEQHAVEHAGDGRSRRWTPGR